MSLRSLEELIKDAYWVAPLVTKVGMSEWPMLSMAALSVEPAYASF